MSYGALGEVGYPVSRDRRGGMRSAWKDLRLNMKKNALAADNGSARTPRPTCQTFLLRIILAAQMSLLTRTRLPVDLIKQGFIRRQPYRGTR